MGHFKRPFDRLRAVLSEVEGRTPGPRAALVGAGLMWLGVVIVAGAHAPTRQDNSIAPNTATASAPKSTSPTPADPAKANANEYLGEEKCLECHEDQKAYHGTPHGRARNPRTPAAKNTLRELPRSWPGARGRGRRRTKIKDPKTLAPREVGETCTDLPQPQRSQRLGRRQARLAQHLMPDLPQRARAEIARRPAQDRERHGNLRAVPRTRGEQGAPVVAHAGARRDKMECTTCHNPHGSQNVKMLREGNSINEACATCHAEKRGPFLWEHAAGRENCVTCHDPHGSNNERMLVAKLPMLCQRCHVSSRHPATIYDNTQVNVTRATGSSGAPASTATQMIHGSNHPVRRKCSCGKRRRMTMRTRTMILIGALLASAPLAAAQDSGTTPSGANAQTVAAPTQGAPAARPSPDVPVASTPKLGTIDFGFRGYQRRR